MFTKRKNSSVLLAGQILVLILVVGLSGCSKKTETASGEKSEKALTEMKMTFAAPHTPPQTYAQVDVAFTDHMKEVSGGKINFTYYPGGTLIGGSEAAAELKAGAADFGWPRVGYSKHGYKLYNANLIWMYNLDPVEDVEAELEIYKKLYELEPMYSEFDGIVPYGANASGTTAWLFTNKPIESLKDIKGMTIRANAAWAKVVTELGGVPLNMPFSELYLAMEKGTIDGILGLPGTVIKGENLGEVIDYAMDIKMNQSPYYAWAFNEKSWNEMPAEAQEMFKSEEGWIEQRVVDQLQGENGPSIEYGKALGINFLDISEEDKNMLYGIMDSVCRENCAVLDGEGYPATEMYEYTQKLIKEFKDSQS